MKEVTVIGKIISGSQAYVCTWISNESTTKHIIAVGSSVMKEDTDNNFRLSNGRSQNGLYEPLHMISIRGNYILEIYQKKDYRKILVKDNDNPDDIPYTDEQLQEMYDRMDELDLERINNNA